MLSGDNLMTTSYRESGAATVETLLITAVFGVVMVFAPVQFALLSFTSLVAADAAFSAARSAVVSSDIKAAERDSVLSGTLVFTSALNPRDSIPTGNPIKKTDIRGLHVRTRGGGEVTPILAGQDYIQDVMFASVIAPLLGASDAFIVTGGRAGSFYGGGRKIFRGSKACPAVMSPDPAFRTRAYPGAKEW
jgi:hypothetical protein